MGIEIGGASGPPNLGGAARQADTHYNGAIEQSAGFDEWTNVANRQAMGRYGEQLPNYTTGGGGPMWENGASGGAGNRGKGSKFFSGARCSFIGVAGTVATPAPNDFFSRLRLNVLTVKPGNNLDYPLAVWRLRAIMGISLGGAAGPGIADDCGIVFMANSGITAYASGMRKNVGNNAPGFGVVFDGAGGALRWISRKVAAGALTESLQISTGSVNVLHEVEFLISSATPSTDATVQVNINGLPALTRSWGAGTVLPNRTDFATWGGTLTPFIRNSDTIAEGNFDLYTLNVGLAAGASAAALL